MTDLPGLAAAALIVVAGLSALTAVGVWLLLGEVRRAGRRAAIDDALATFGPALERAREEPRLLLGWHPVAEAARRLSPEAFAALDDALGQRFPFTARDVENAHAKWTARWLAWERSHDFDYKLKASAAEDDLQRRGQLDTSVGKARLAAIEREQLERYQERYEEYVRVAKALAALDTGTASAREEVAAREEPRGGGPS